MISQDFFFISGEMMFLNEGTLLENIRKRYYKNKIYVSNAILMWRNCCKAVSFLDLRSKHSDSSESLQRNLRSLFCCNNPKLPGKVTWWEASSRFRHRWQGVPGHKGAETIPVHHRIGRIRSRENGINKASLEIPVRQLRCRGGPNRTENFRCQPCSGGIR